MTVTSCANCSEQAVGRLNGTPLCQVHLREVQEEWICRDDAQQEQEARRLGIEIPPEVLRDREFGPAVWLLSTPHLASKTWRYVDLERRQVQWDELLEVSKPWSHHERLMVELALNFWNGEGRFDPSEWGGGLDRHNWQRLMEALALARGKRC